MNWNAEDILVLKQETDFAFLMQTKRLRLFGYIFLNAKPRSIGSEHGIARLVRISPFAF
jgi:hypothetical protein